LRSAPITAAARSPRTRTQVTDSLALGGGRHHFFAAISLSIALSSIASARSFFSFTFSSSSTFSRLASTLRDRRTCPFTCRRSHLRPHACDKRRPSSLRPHAPGKIPMSCSFRKPARFLVHPPGGALTQNSGLPGGLPLDDARPFLSEQTPDRDPPVSTGLNPKDASHRERSKRHRGDHSHKLYGCSQEVLTPRIEELRLF
jgi:hypothetical protein